MKKYIIAVYHLKDEVWEKDNAHFEKVNFEGNDDLGYNAAIAYQFLVDARMKMYYMLMLDDTYSNGKAGTVA